MMTAPQPVRRERLSNRRASETARDSAIVLSLAVQHGADVEIIRRGLCRGAHGRASGPLGRALDLIAEHEATEANPGVLP
jgi:hypothetical protein